MTRTALEHSPAKERLLDAAQTLMLAKGFTATTVDEICEKAKLTKGSFFHYFESKDHLGRQVLERFCTSSQKRQQACCGHEADPLKRLFSYIDNAIRMSKDPCMSNGCLLGLFSQELSDTNAPIRSACRKGFEEWAEIFGAEVAKAKARYAPKASFVPRELAEHFIAIMEGSMILGKAKGDRTVVGRNLTHFKAYVKGLFGK
ncbi:MAG: TetR/AcrR family transcriptional regulator [Candidatus Omnitrophica bacterium]|nr:TetR/AcrR family transcriptional regulator [Candidatus Omnitrophota bacterium]